jgi:aspartyl-tRNA synthetase
MKHRYLDLRGDRLGHNIRQRSKVSWTIRNYLHQLDFTEIETPVLLRSTPEGAREYLVPTRNNQKQTSHSSDASSSSLPVKRPQFFALQQSPQQPKQLLIASGVTDRYFQIAKCFRDEDGRKDRQAEFTQIDLEMGFVSGAEVFKKEDGWRIGGREIRQVIEGMIKTIWRAVGRHEEADELDREGFLVMQYDEAMQRYGSDKPDLRYGVELVDMGDAIKGEGEGTDGFRPKSELELLCFTPPNGSFTNAEMGELFGTNPDLLEGVESFKVEAGSINSMAKLLMRKSRNMRDLLTEKEVTGEEVSVTSLVRKLQEAQDKGLIAQGVEKGDISYLFTALKKLPASGGSTKLGDLRRLLIASLVEKGKVTLPSKPHFAWITEFPLFTLDDGDKAQLSQGRWSSSHHPFTSPMEEDIPRIQQALCDDAMVSREEKEMIMHTCKGQHYDLVLNGVEIGGGSIRIHDTSLQRDILKNALELSSTELNRFNHLLQALACGAPPHGGIALGFDRLMAILCDTATIRDVMAFPKSATSKDLLFQCPDSLEQDSLLEAYGLRSASPSSSNE